MQKHIVFALCGCLFSIAAISQDDAIDQVLKEVEQNNKELKAQRAYLESAAFALSTGNNLPDPQVDAFYLPFGTHAPGDYTEFQVSQTVQFPTVYATRGELIARKKEYLQLEYDKLRQDILLDAKRLCQELIYLQKRKQVEGERLAQAKKVFDQVETLYEKQQVGVLEMNKARIHWMQAQFVSDQINGEISNGLLKLQGMNGDEAVAFEERDYSSNLETSSPDSLWNQRLETDPVMRSLLGKEAVSAQAVKLSKSNSLPNISAGFNRQGVAGSVYSGVYGGLTIPLWSNRNQVKAAKAHLEYNQLHTQAQQTNYYTDFQGLHQRYLIQLGNYKEYDSTLGSLNSEPLLLQSYQLGQLSFIEYYNELRFYRDAYDRLLLMEKELHQQKAEILKHQL